MFYPNHSNSAFLGIDVRRGLIANKLSEGHPEEIIEPALPIRSCSFPVRWQSLDFHIESFLIILVSTLQDLRILIVYFLALVEALLACFVGLQFAGLDALVVLFGELEVDLHAFLPLGGIDGLDVGAVQHVPLYHN